MLNHEWVNMDWDNEAKNPDQFKVTKEHSNQVDQVANFAATAISLNRVMSFSGSSRTRLGTLRKKDLFHSLSSFSLDAGDDEVSNFTKTQLLQQRNKLDRQFSKQQRFSSIDEDSTITTQLFQNS